jgi:hypothetical protein
MRISKLLLASLGISSLEAIRFTNPNFNNITVGSPFNITWTDAAGPVTLTLLKGGTPAYFVAAGTIASKHFPTRNA